MIEHDIWFSALNLKNSTKIQLLKKLKSTENIWHYSRDSSLIFLNDANEIKIKNKLSNSYNTDEIGYIKRIIYKNNIKTVTCNDAHYPENLKFFDDSPCIIYYKGKIENTNSNKSVAVVGSRNCSPYGKSIAASISGELSKNNVNIISGLARGIDSAAHNSCILSNGFTCGVLGCGLDIVYPKENYKLYNEMFESGCVISEFVPGTKPNNYNFPIRNRIISGLSDIVLIVEAGEKSGSLITAGLALDQGKSVMAVPGSVFSDNSKGSNRLLHDGAHVFTGMQDIFELLSMNYNIVNNQKNRLLNNLQSSITNTLSDKPLHIDEIINITHIDIKQLYELLFEL
jgi:DNA processing protein